ncbi:glycosyltransferase [Actinoplanes sp. NPDC026619]|uniref:glycosyltransferase n=1 Tax=Actinoplanes sp. NPDC026619 TaxID=3155798 RepID=UPI0033F4FCF8
MDATPFRFSIIIPTYNRREILLDTVNSIAGTQRPWPCELIVVIDGSQDGSAEALRELDLPLPLTVVEQTNQGAAAARNTGAAAARGELLLFLDDDMAVEKDLIIEHEKTLMAGADASVGHMHVDQRSPHNLMTRGVERWAAQRHDRLEKSGGKLGMTDFLTGQLSVRADYFRKVAGFDGGITADGAFGGEDTDLVYRLLQNGAQLRFSAKAISHQRYVVSAGKSIRQWEQAAHADVALSRKHPGMGAMLNAGYGGDSIVGRLTRAVAALPAAVLRPFEQQVSRRVDNGRMDTATDGMFTMLRRIAYWRGVRSRGGYDLSTDPGVRILAYHQIEDVDDPNLAAYSVRPELFEQQLEALIAAGWSFITGDDLLEHLAGRPLKPRSVLLTFDDAYESLLINATPIMTRLGVRGMTLVVSDELGGYNSWDAAEGHTKLPLLDADQLDHMRPSGWEIDSHTRRHAHLTQLRSTELAADLAGSREAIARAGLGTPRFLAYPFGEHDRRVRAHARKAGYSAAFALRTENTHPGNGNRYALPRIEVGNQSTPDKLLRQLANPAVIARGDVLRRELRGLASGVLSRVRHTSEQHNWNHDGAALTLPSVRTGVWCCDFELAGEGRFTSMVPPRDETAMRVLVRLHGEPLGYLTVNRTGTEQDNAEVRRATWAEFSDLLVEHLKAEGTPVPALAERAAWRAPERPASCPNRVEADDLVSVVVCTRNRSESLPDCLDRLAAVTYANVEFIIVDNAPSDDSTERVVQRYASADERFRYVRESRPGLSRARNAGLAAARGRYLAYTDDDVAVDSGWIHGLVRGFQRRSDVACVTGLVCTAAISNGSEAYFDARLASWSTRCRPQFFDMSMRSEHGVLYPFSPGIFGTGASFAFDRERLVRLGGFDEALGAGTLTRGGEDLDIFVRVMLDHGAIAYEPSAVVWHHHRADEEALLRQMYGYGTGFTAYVTKLLMSRSTRGEVLRRVPAGLAKIVRIKRQTDQRLTETVPTPAGAMRREFTGYLTGPVLYVRARRAVRRELIAS